MSITIERVKELLVGATPGQWLVYRNEQQDGKLSVKVPYAHRGMGKEKTGNDYSYTVCTVGHPFSKGEFDHERENARLIAAAPDIARLAIELSEEVERLRGKYEKP